MSNWTGYSEHSYLSGKLFASEGNDFERNVLPVLRTIWLNAIRTSARKALDRAGIDIVVWSDTQPYPLAVQCKGFEVRADEIGSHQITQCLDSIASFKASGIRATTYLLGHNRDDRNPTFRRKIQQSLKELIDSGQVETAELWDRQKLIQQAFDTIYENIRKAFSKGTLQLAHELSNPKRYEPIDIVPLKVSTMLTNQFGLLSINEGTREMSSAAEKILYSDTKITILVGKSGYGKTTATSCAINTAENKIFYIPAAIISKYTNSTRDVLTQCVNIDSIICGVQDEDLEVFKSIFRAAVGKLFSNFEESNQGILILDGIDESVYFTREGGLQWLLNSFRTVLMPIVLTIRTELWHQLREDFETLTGRTMKGGHSKSVKVRHIELLEWEDMEIIELSRRYLSTLEDHTQQSKIIEFIKLVEHGEYQKLYGDIPRRPLFLDWILETVSERGIQPIGRAQLFQQYAVKKIKRDIFDVMAKGGPGRAPLSDREEPPSESIELAFSLMIHAAGLMTEIIDTEFVLLPECFFDDLRNLHPTFTNILLPGLALRSLLISLPKKELERTKLAFTHKVYQEIFLARYLLLYPARAQGAKIPQDVLEWMNDLTQKHPYYKGMPPDSGK